MEDKGKKTTAKSKKKTKRATEKAIETAILMYLNYLPQCFAWKNNSTGVYDPKRGVFRSNRNKFVINGVSDILGIYKGKLLAVEVKTVKGKVTKEQENFLERVRKLGGITCVARCVDDVRELIRSYDGN